MLALVATVSCNSSPPDAGPAEGALEVRVVPLAMGPITEAVYQVTVKNADGDVVWVRDIASSRFGDGAGAAAYVGACDPTANPNLVELVVVSLADPGGQLSFANPAPPEDPLTQTIDCDPMTLASVTFEFTAAVAAETGFFDIAITFDDIFCSAKFDCLNDDDDPLELLFNPITGERGQTAVLGFACTAGPDQDTYLWMDPLEIVCAEGGPFDVNVAGGPGNLDPDFPGPVPDYERLLFQAATYRGVEQLDTGTAWNKGYWNVALGLNTDAFPYLDTCIVHGLASASNGDFDIGQTPPHVRWPTVQFTIPLLEGGALTCGRYQLDQGPEVRTVYTSSDGHRFYASYRPATDTLEIQVGDPDATTIVVCADEAINPNQQTLCSIVPRQDGLLVPVQYTDFDNLSASAGSVSAVSPQELSTGFTFTFTAPSTSQVVTIDTGVGATTTVTVLATADATSAISCAAATLAVGEQTLCTITAAVAGQPVYSAASLFDPSATPDGTVGPINEPFGAALTFTYTAGATTGTMTIGNGLGAFTSLVVYGIPDNTSTVSCQDDRLLPGAQTYCTIIPRQGGQVVLAPASRFSVTADPNGEIGPLSPAIGTAINFVFTAPADLGVKTIDIGFSTPGSRTTVEVYSNVDPDEVVPPGPPVIIAAAGQDGQIFIAYLAPEENGGSPNLVYTTVCTKTDDGSTALTITANTVAVVPNLQNGASYICIVFASNEAGDGPPSDPTPVLIPNAIPQQPGLVIATTWNAVGAQHYLPARSWGDVGAVVSDSGVFLAANYEIPSDTTVTGALVAQPFGVYGTDPVPTPSNSPAEEVGAVVSDAHAFLAAGYDSGLGQPTPLVVAPPLGSYGANRYAYPPSPAPAGAIVTAPAQFYAERFHDYFSPRDSGAIVAGPLTTYQHDRYRDQPAADERVGHLFTGPSVYTAFAFVDPFQPLVAGPLVAGPLTIGDAETYVPHELLPELPSSALFSGPAVFGGSHFNGAYTLVIDGALVATPLNVYQAARFFDPDLSAGLATGVLVTGPTVFDDDPTHLIPPADPPGPPTITNALGLDGAITLTWVAPEDDGGAPISGYTVVCTQTPSPSPPATPDTVSLATELLEGAVAPLNNGMPYTCVVYATNANGDGPPSDPTAIIIPSADAEHEGALVAAPLPVFGANAYADLHMFASGAVQSGPALFAASHNVDLYTTLVDGAVVATPLTALAGPRYDDPALRSAYDLGVVFSGPAVAAIDYIDEWGAAQFAIVVAPPWGTVGAHRMNDPALIGAWGVGAVAAGPGAFVDNDYGMLPTQHAGSLVAAPWGTFGESRYTTPELAVTRVGAATSAPGSFAVAFYGAAAADDVVGALVAEPLTTLGSSYRDLDLAAEQRAGVVASTDGVFAGAGYVDPFRAATGAVTARPLTTWREDRYSAAPVTAVGVVGDAPSAFVRDPSEPIPTTPPGPPVITDGAADDAAITIVWDPPVDDGGSPALIYTVTCTSVDGLHSGTATTAELDATVTGLHNGTPYTCVVFAKNGLGEGPDSEPSAVLTPNGVHDADGVLVARPLPAYGWDRYGDSAARAAGAVASAPAPFLGVGGFEDPPLSVLVAAPVGAFGHDRYALAQRDALGALPSAPAAFLGAHYGASFEAVPAGPLVAAPLSTYRADRYADGFTAVGQLVSAPGSFSEAGVGVVTTPPASPLVAAPWSAYGAGRYDTGFERFVVGVLLSAPGAFTGAGYTSPSDATPLAGIVAPPLTTYPSARFYDPTAANGSAVGPSFGAPRSFVVYVDQDAAPLSVLVAPALTVNRAGRWDLVGLTSDGRSGALLAPVAVFADDPGLLTPNVEELGAPHFTDAYAAQGSVVLAWAPPSEDGGLTITGYEVTCSAQDGSGESGSLATDALGGTVTGLIDGVPYLCVVHADAGAVHGPDSAPAAILVPHSSPDHAGLLVATPLGAYRYPVFGDITAAAAGPILAGPAAFFGARHQGPLDEGAASAVVAAPLGAGGAYRYAPEAVAALGRAGVVSDGPSTFAAGSPPVTIPHVFSGLVAGSLTVYRADRYVALPALAAASSGPAVGAPRSFAAGTPPTLFAEGVSGPLVASPWPIYGAERYALAASGRTGVALAAPAAFSSFPFASDIRVDGLVATPLTVYNGSRFAGSAAAWTGAAYTGPAAYAAARYVPAAAQVDDALVAVPLAAYRVGRYDDRASAASLSYTGPAVWAEDPDVAQADHAPSAPAITDGVAGDATITLSWTLPADDGGSPALIYTVTCTSVDGLHSGTATTAELSATVTGLHNGTPYTCVVFATNGLGDGPDSEPSAVLTPNGVHDADGILVARPLPAYGWDRYGDSAARAVGPVASAPAPFLGVGGFEDPPLSALVAAPVGAFGHDRYALAQRDALGALPSAPAAFLGAHYGASFEAVPAGPLVAAPLSTYRADRYADGFTAVGQLVSAPGTFSKAGVGVVTTPPASPLVAAPWSAYGAGRHDTGLERFVVGVLLSAPGAFTGAGYTSPSDATPLAGVVAPPLTTYPSARFHDATVANGSAVGPPFGAPRSFIVFVDQDAAPLSVLVAPALTVNRAGRWDLVGLTSDGRSGALLAPVAVFADDPGLLTPNVEELGAPHFTDAYAAQGSVVLAWAPPSEDGGLTITRYEVTCRAQDGSGEGGSLAIDALGGTVTGLIDGVPYLCVVHADAGAVHGPDSAPAAILVPHSNPDHAGLLVATPLGAYRYPVFGDIAAAAAGPILAGPAAFFGARHQGPLDEGAAGAVVAAPLGAGGAYRYAPEAVAALGRAGVVSDGPGTFAAGSPPETIPHVFSGLVAGSLTVYRADHYVAQPALAAASSGPAVGAPRIFAAGTPPTLFAEGVSGPVVASPWSTYGTERYGLAASGRTGVALAAPGSFSSLPSASDIRTDGLVATPLTAYNGSRFAGSAAAWTGAAYTGPAAYAAARYVPAAAQVDDALVAVPLAAYRVGRFDDRAAAASLSYTGPAVWAEDPDVAQADHAPSAPAITDGVAGDATITLNWTLPADDGGDLALIYTATCTSADGLHRESLSTIALGGAVPGLHNGTAYTCVVHATNSFGAGPDSAPYGPLTPNSDVDAAGALVAQPLTVGGTARYLLAADAARVSAVLDAPASFIAAGYVPPQDDALAGLVAAPLAVLQQGRYGAPTAAFTGVLASAPASYQQSSNAFNAAPTVSPVVAPSWNIGGTHHYGVAQLHDGHATGAVTAAPGAFIVFGDALGPAISHAVAPPWNVMGVHRYSAPAAARAGDARSTPRAFFAAHFQPVPTGFVQGLVARPLTAYQRLRYDAPLPGEVGRIGVTAAAPAVYADDADLLAVPTVGPPDAPSFTDAVAGSGELTLSWAPPADDGGASVTAYTVTCTRTDASDTATATVAALTVTLSGLVDTVFTQTGSYVGYRCVVFATNAHGDGPDSAPTAVLFPSAAATVDAALVATPLTTQSATRVAGPDAPQGAAGALPSTPAVFYGAGFADSGHPVTDAALTARPLTVFAVDRYASPSLLATATTGAVTGAPAALFATGYESGFLATPDAPLVAAPLTVFADARYADAPAMATTVVSSAASFAAARFVDGFAAAAIGAVAAAPWTAVGRPYVYAIAPSALFPGTTTTVMLDGIGLAEVDHLLFYPPASSTPSLLVTHDAFIDQSDASLTLNISLDLATPPGAWTLVVVTASGIASPAENPGNQLGFITTFTVP